MIVISDSFGLSLQEANEVIKHAKIKEMCMRKAYNDEISLKLEHVEMMYKTPYVDLDRKIRSEVSYNKLSTTFIVISKIIDLLIKYRESNRTLIIIVVNGEGHINYSSFNRRMSAVRDIFYPNHQINVHGDKNKYRYDLGGQLYVHFLSASELERSVRGTKLEDCIAICLDVLNDDIINTLNVSGVSNVFMYNEKRLEFEVAYNHNFYRSPEMTYYSLCKGFVI